MSERGFLNNLMGLQSMARLKMKESMVPHKEVDIDEAKKIINFQISCLKERGKEFKEFFADLPKSFETVQMTPTILNLILNDFVFLEYKYEEEDFMKCINPDVLTTNPELGTVFQEMEMCVIQLVQELEIVSPEMAKYMQQSIMHPESMNMPGMPPGMMPPGVPPGMLPPGAPSMGGMMPPPGMMPPGMLPPGTDPMAMLQFQQMQAQMSAMQNQMNNTQKKTKK